MSDQVMPVAEPVATPEPTRRRLLVVASDPRSANGALRADFRDAVVVVPDASGSLPTDTASDYDEVVVADGSGDPTTVAARLALASRHLSADGSLAVALTADASDGATVADPQRWSDALDGYTADGVDPDGALLRLRPSASPDPTTGPLLLGAVQAARAGRAAEVAALASSASTGDFAAAGFVPADALAEAQEENDTLRRKVRSLERSPAVRIARRISRARRAGPAAALRRLSGRELAVLAAAAVVGLLVIVAVVAVLTAATDSLGTAVVLTVIGLLVLLGLIRGEIARWRLARTVRQIGTKLENDSAKHGALLRRVSARTRRHSTKLDAIENRVTTVSAAGLDTAQTVSLIAEDLRAAHPERVRRIVAADSTKQYEQLQAAMNLFALVDVDAPVPPMRGWAVSPDALLVLLDELLTHRPALSLECGSGSSTLWTALAIKKFGLSTRIVSLEHQDEYRVATEALLARHGVSDIAEVRLAPLVPTGIAGHDTPWYDVSAVADLRDVGLLFIDGPPEASGPLARYPALPLLLPHLAEDAVVVLDDAVRADEKTAIARWLEEVPGLTTEYLRTEKGTSVVRRSPQVRGA